MTGCAVEGCEGRMKARGWCSTHYKRWAKFGNPLMLGRRPVIKLEVLDLLQVHGGWWTIPGLADRLDVKRNTVQKVLGELVREGQIRRRKLGDRATDRPEWKAL